MSPICLLVSIFFFFLIFQEIRIIMSFFHTNSQTCKTLNNKIRQNRHKVCLFSTYAHNVIMHVCIINGLIFRDFFFAAISGINKKNYVTIVIQIRDQK